MPALRRGLRFLEERVTEVVVALRSQESLVAMPARRSESMVLLGGWKRPSVG